MRTSLSYTARRTVCLAAVAAESPAFCAALKHAMRTTMATAATHARRSWPAASAVPSMSAPTNRPMATITAMFARSATHCAATLQAMYLKACGTMAVRRLLNMLPPNLGR